MGLLCQHLHNSPMLRLLWMFWLLLDRFLRVRLCFPLQLLSPQLDTDPEASTIWLPFWRTYPIGHRAHSFPLAPSLSALVWSYPRSLCLEHQSSCNPFDGTFWRCGSEVGLRPLLLSIIVWMHFRGHDRTYSWWPALLSWVWENAKSRFQLSMS